MEKIVFTNGCFDLLHPGHVDLLNRAKALGTRLVVGINSDESVRAIKGAPRPFYEAADRRAVLLGLKAVDDVRIFSETTPENLIREIAPDVLVKGGDWLPHEIVGADFVLAKGGEVHSLPLKEGFSTTKIAEKISASEKKTNTEPDDKKAERETNRKIESSLANLTEAFAYLQRECVEQIKKSFEMLEAARQDGKKIFFIAEHPGVVLPDYFTRLRIAKETGEDESNAEKGDLLVVFSDGGEAPRIVESVMNSRRLKRSIIALTGRNGKKLASLCDAGILIPAESSPEIRAVQAAILMLWRELLLDKPDEF